MQRGMQAELSRKTKICQPVLSKILTGKRRATPKQAEAMEKVFLSRGISLTRIDLVWGIRDGQTVADFLKRREQANNTDNTDNLSE